MSLLRRNITVDKTQNPIRPSGHDLRGLALTIVNYLTRLRSENSRETIDRKALDDNKRDSMSPLRRRITVDKTQNPIRPFRHDLRGLVRTIIHYLMRLRSKNSREPLDQKALDDNKRD